MNFDVGFIFRIIPIMLKYSTVTLSLSFFAIVLGFIISFAVALAVYAKVPVLSGILKVYISFFRGTPLMSQLFCFYFGILPLFKNIVLKVSSFQAALIVISLASSAYRQNPPRHLLHPQRADGGRSIHRYDLYAGYVSHRPAPSPEGRHPHIIQQLYQHCKGHLPGICNWRQGNDGNRPIGGSLRLSLPGGLHMRPVYILGHHFNHGSGSEADGS